MPGGFFQGLSIGINDEFTANRVAKEKRNAEEKSQVLKLLGSLADQVEPESQGLLYRHIGDVIGLKGKQKGIFARLTGADLDSDQGAMQSKLQEILGSIQGPGARQAASPRPTITGATLGPGGMPSVTGVGQTPDRRDPRALYLRDPRQEELSQLRAKFGLQRDSRLAEIEERDRLSYQTRSKLQEDQQAFTASQTSIKEENRLDRELNTRARIKAKQKRGTVVPTVQEEMEAAAELERENGLRAGVLQARVGLMGAQQKLAEYQTQIDPSTGQMVGKVMTEGERKRFDQGQQQAAQALFGKYTSARAKAVALGQQQQQLFERIKGIVESDSRLIYDATRNIILDKATGEPAPSQMKNARMKGLLDQYAATARSKAEAMSELGGHREQLGSTYKDLYDIGNEVWDVRPRTEVGGVAPAGAPRTGGAGPTSQAPGRAPAGRRIPDMGQVSTWSSSNDYQPGETISVGQMQFKVLQKLGSTGIDNSYQIRRIR